MKHGTAPRRRKPPAADGYRRADGRRTGSSPAAALAWAALAWTAGAWAAARGPSGCAELGAWATFGWLPCLACGALLRLAWRRWRAGFARRAARAATLHVAVRAASRLPPLDARRNEPTKYVWFRLVRRS